jgi:uncharacterized delta-60 repeat protein
LKKWLLWAVVARVSIFAASILDTTFDPGTGANGIVEQALPVSGGKILICGNFTTFNGQSRSYIARLNSDGSLDHTFFGQPSYWVRNMSVQGDGKIIIGGFFKGVQGVPRSLIARLNTDGSLDTSFDPGSGMTNIIAGGIDGNIDPFVFWTAVQPDGKILATGNFRNYNGASSVGIVRINPDGSRDTSFNVGGGLDSWGRHIRLQSNGQIVLAGWFTSYNGKSANRLVRINPDGSPDYTFNPFFGDRTAIYATVAVGGDKMVASGHSLNLEGLFLREMERLNADGSVDSSFVGYTNDKTESLAVQGDGKVIAVGNFTAANGVQRRSVARFNPDGSLDTVWGAQIDNYVWSVALQGDGKALISGGFYTVDGQSRNGVARLLTGATGTPPPATTTAPLLSATANSSSQITLSWSDSAADRNGYSVERKTGAGGSYAAIATLSGSVRSYVNSGLAAGTVYYYRLRATSTSGASAFSNEAGATTTPSTTTPPTTGGSASATFVSADANTHGTWKGVYGGEGYHVFSDQQSYPSYIRVTPAGKSDWIWQDSTTDVDALQKVNSSTERMAACWYSSSPFSIGLAVTDGAKHRVTLYFLDWDVLGRNETVQVVDGDTGAVLNSQTVSSFAGGLYLTWEIGGHVKVNITPNAGNAVVSGIFFGPASSAPPPLTTQTVATPAISPNGGRFSSAQAVALSCATAGAEIRYSTNGNDPTSTSTLYTGTFSVSATTTVKAKGFKSGLNASATASATFTISSAPPPPTTGANFVFVGTDTTTKGNWRGVYGAEGYNVIGSSANYPSYAQVSGAGKQDWVWNQTTADGRGLQTADGSSRIAGCWYQPGTFTINVNFTDGSTHRLALYLCDWDFAGRTETVDLIDGNTGAVLQARSVSGFSGGQYLIWDLKGKFQVRFTMNAGPNAVVNGVFFGAPARQF